MNFFVVPTILLPETSQRAAQACAGPRGCRLATVGHHHPWHDYGRQSLRRSMAALHCRSVSALRLAIDSLLRTFPRCAVVFHRGEQIFLVGPATPRRVDQAIQVGSIGFDAAVQVLEPRVESMKQNGVLQLSSP